MQLHDSLYSAPESFFYFFLLCVPPQTFSSLHPRLPQGPALVHLCNNTRPVKVASLLQNFPLSWWFLTILLIVQWLQACIWYSSIADTRDVLSARPYS